MWGFRPENITKKAERSRHFEGYVYTYDRNTEYKLVEKEVTDSFVSVSIEKSAR